MSKVNQHIGLIYLFVNFVLQGHLFGIHTVKTEQLLFCLQISTDISVLLSWWVVLITTIFSRGRQSCCHNDNPTISRVIVANASQCKTKQTWHDQELATALWFIRGETISEHLSPTSLPSFFLNLQHSWFFFHNSLTNSAFFSPLTVQASSPASPLCSLLLCL